MTRAELLAPAGSLAAFFAAMEAGADAVYCGLKEFSARAKAKNFTLEEMELLAAYAHGQGRRLYVTLNTLLKEAELPRLVEVLAAIASWPADGIIIQDLGLWRLARHHFPEIPLHASTQMTIHNAAGVKVLEGMGFSRAVLARELTLEEIAAIRSQTRMELEHFVHGALCYSISGHCLFSSFLTGQSGNRGRCAQPCRRRYSVQGKPGFHFSTSDLSAIGLVPRLLKAGVMSLKIEGRMKGAEYVSAVVSAYRLVLDASPAEQGQAIKEAEARLAAAFGRATTSGLLKGKAPAALALPGAQGGIGRHLGQVAKVQGDSIFLTVADVVHVGDRLRIQPRSDLSGSAFTVQELALGPRPLKRAEAKSFVRIRTPFRGAFQPGDAVYKVATGKEFTLSDEACQRRLAAVLPSPVPVRLLVSCRGENRLWVQAEALGGRWREEYEVEMQPAAHSPLSREALARTFAKTGHGGIALGSFAVEGLPPVVIKPSRLNEVRRAFYATLAPAVEAARQSQRTERVARVLTTLLPARPPRPAVAATLAVVVKGGRDLALLHEGVTRLILPLTPELVEAVAKEGGRLPGSRERIVWEIPAIIFEGEWLAFCRVVRQLQGQGFSAFRLNNLAHFQLVSGPESALRVTAGPWLYALNSQAVLALAELGVAEFSLSLEDDQGNMAAILARELPLAATATVYAPIPLLTSRIPLRGVRPGALLTADSGEEIRLEHEGGLSVARSGRAFSLLGRLRELQGLGCGEMVIDLSQVGAVSPEGRRVLAAAGEDSPLAGSTLFNFDRGLA